MAIQLETCENIITASKALAQYVSANKKGGWKKIPSMNKNMLFATNSEDRETSADKISTQGIEIFDTKTDTKDHSLLELGLKRQGLYYAYLQIDDVKQISQIAWWWPSEFVPGGVSSIVIHTWNPMRNSQAQNAFLLSIKTTHEMDDSATNKFSESNILMPRTHEEFFHALAVKSGILGLFLLDESLVLRNMSGTT